ncbi:MAG: hypothetical protein KAU50_11635 [Candidatus Marinimicrobia bacterium]|nr:hypothetical protein [Candidatus Neomarinimicrobiota bacterium]
MIDQSPENRWDLIYERYYSLTVSDYQHTPAHGGSYTLYVGRIDGDAAREAGILIRFPDAQTDSSLIANYESAYLYLFVDDLSGIETDTNAIFSVSQINAVADSVWTEGDTALTISDFADTSFISDTSLVIGDALVYTSFSSIDTANVGHLALPVSQAAMEPIHSGVITNNGYLITRADGGSVASFTSSELVRTPYLVLNYTDTTDTGGVTTKTVYYRAADDLSIYPPSTNIDTTPGGSHRLNFSDGQRLHIDLNHTFGGAEQLPVAGAKLILFVDRDNSTLNGSAMEIHVPARVVEGSSADSLKIWQSLPSRYDSDVDSLTINLNVLLDGYINGTLVNHGIDLVVRPSNNDLDDLYLWGHGTSDSVLKPRLEIIYGVPYQGGAN